MGDMQSLATTGFVFVVFRTSLRRKPVKCFELPYWNWSFSSNTKYWIPKTFALLPISPGVLLYDSVCVCVLTVALWTILQTEGDGEHGIILKELCSEGIPPQVVTVLEGINQLTNQPIEQLTNQLCN